MKHLTVITFGLELLVAIGQYLIWRMTMKTRAMVTETKRRQDFIEVITAQMPFDDDSPSSAEWLAVIDVLPNGAGLLLVELAAGVGAAEVQAKTGARLALAERIGTF